MTLTGMAAVAGIIEDQVAEIVRISVETVNGLNPAPVTENAVRGFTLAACRGQRPQ
ncbi:hypothetical protein [Jiella pacifica]|uniref:Uncharacterized protein n=1 Tax=Jiella pacifica TaxID=2696469 RepID=A0A6N9SVT1_9HYPH|nr:hypothetical protein [Jiella pacifica]NDW03170.1 hypothetical protein [Jiella pacifica]